jgi:hypothetical protein
MNNFENFNEDLEEINNTETNDFSFNDYNFIETKTTDNQEFLNLDKDKKDISFIEEIEEDVKKFVSYRKENNIQILSFDECVEINQKGKMYIFTILNNTIFPDYFIFEVEQFIYEQYSINQFIKYVPNPSIKILNLIITNEKTLNNVIEVITEEKEIELITKEPTKLFYFKNPKKKTILKALEINNNLITKMLNKDYIDDEIILFSLRQNFYNIKHFKNPKYEYIKTAFDIDKRTLSYMVFDNLKEKRKIYFKFLELDYKNIQYIPTIEQTFFMQLKTIIKNKDTINYIKTPYSTIKLLSYIF